MHALAPHAADPDPMAEMCRRIRIRFSVRELARVPWEELTVPERERVRRWLREFNAGVVDATAPEYP